MTKARSIDLKSSIGLTAGLGLTLSLAAGCLPSGPDTMDAAAAPPTVDVPTNLSAKQLFNTKVLPLLTATCGACHSRSVGVGPGFLASVSSDPTVYDPYPIVVGWNGFIVSDPVLSQLLTKGQHEGPALTMDQSTAVLTWLDKEKAERDAVTVIPFKPQLPPQAITLSASKASPQYNYFDLSKLDTGFNGATIRFVATTLNANGTGLELSDLRLINTKPGAPVAGDQRSIHYKSPLFVLWRGGLPYPDPGNSFDSYDRTITLNQNDPSTTGVAMGPGLLVLDQYQPGYSISIVFDTIELVKPVSGSNPCSTAQSDYFKNNIAYHYLGATSGGSAVTCAKAGACHNSQNRAAEIDMGPAAAMASNLDLLCEQLKFYNSLGIIARNTDPNQTANHVYKWYTSDCNLLTPAEPGCFANFSSKLDSWKNTP